MIKTGQFSPEDVKRIRDGMGWTQTEAAAKVGVAQNTWARWERGTVIPHPLRVPELLRLLRQAERKRGAAPAGAAKS